MKGKRVDREQLLQQGNLVEIEIEDLSSHGDGVGRVGTQVVFVPDTVPGDRALVRILRLKRQTAYGKLDRLLHPSAHRIRPRCIVADKCGSCQWQHIQDEYQQKAKRDRVIQSLQRIGGFSEVNVAPIVAADSSLGYRNKATYPFKLSQAGKVQTGYYQRHSHQLVNLNQCPVQDERLNLFLLEIKQDIEERGWSIYDEKQHGGQLRYLSLRIGKHTGEVLLTLVATETQLAGVREQAKIWLERYPSLVGIALNHNPDPTNVIFGKETRTIAGQPYLRETFAGLDLHLRPDTFFQVNTEAAEVLLDVIIEQLDLQGDEVLIDAYCGIGTFSLPLARRLKQVIGIESYPESVLQAQKNARLNQIENATFIAGKVESLLPQLQIEPDIVLLDPPRKGCDPTVIDALAKLQPSRIVYISCQPATLARDLKLICQNHRYHLTCVQPADFFPQTAHVECAAFLRHEARNMI